MVRVVHPFRLEARDYVDLQTEQRGGETRGGGGRWDSSFEPPSRVVDLEGFPEEPARRATDSCASLGGHDDSTSLTAAARGGLHAALGLLQTFELEGDFGEEPGAGERE